MKGAHSRDIKLSNNVETNDRIPKRIYLTHKYDICNNTIPSHSQFRISQNEKNYFLIRENVQRIKQFNSDFKVICFDDQSAYNYIKSVEPKFAEYFKNEPLGMYKSDLFRLIVLYHEGGYYFDSDMEPIISLNKVINKNATFTSVINRKKLHIFQSYLGSIKHNPILRMNLNIFDEYYSNKKPFPKNGGTVIMGDTLRIYTNQSSLVEIQKKSKFHDQIIHLLQEKTYNASDADDILVHRHQHYMYEMAVYDHLTNLYPFWSRVLGYENTWNYNYHQ